MYAVNILVHTLIKERKTGTCTLNILALPITNEILR